MREELLGHPNPTVSLAAVSVGVLLSFAAGWVAAGPGAVAVFLFEPERKWWSDDVEG